MSRRFPLPWTVHHNDDAYWVEDAAGKRFAFTYFRDDDFDLGNPVRMRRDEARRIAANVARLPELLKRE